MRHLSKEELNTLRALARKLPPTYTLGSTYHNMVVENLEARKSKHSFLIVPDVGMNPEIISNAPNVVKVPKEFIFPVNHYRRLRKAWIEGNLEGVKKYCSWVDQNNRFLNDSGVLKVSMDVVRSVIMPIL